MNHKEMIYLFFAFVLFACIKYTDITFYFINLIKIKINKRINQQIKRVQININLHTHTLYHLILRTAWLVVESYFPLILEVSNDLSKPKSLQPII
jgi:hypothetical protein